MFKRVIEYEDYDGNPQQRTAWFHLNQPEMLRIEALFEKKGGVKGVIEAYEPNGNIKDAILLIEHLLCDSYGVRTPDAQGITKSPELRAEWMGSAAYEEIFNDMLTDTDFAVEFFNGIVPKERPSKKKGSK